MKNYHLDRRRWRALLLQPRATREVAEWMTGQDQSDCPETHHQKPRGVFYAGNWRCDLVRRVNTMHLVILGRYLIVKLSVDWRDLDISADLSSQAWEEVLELRLRP